MKPSSFSPSNDVAIWIICDIPLTALSFSPRIRNKTAPLEENTLSKDHPRACGRAQLLRSTRVRSSSCSGLWRNSLRTKEVLENDLWCLANTIPPTKRGPWCNRVVARFTTSCLSHNGEYITDHLPPIQRDGCALSFQHLCWHRIIPDVVSTVHKMTNLLPWSVPLGDHLRNEAGGQYSACFALEKYSYDGKKLRNLRRFEEVSSLLEDASKYSAKAEIRLDADEIRERLPTLRRRRWQAWGNRILVPSRCHAKAYKWRQTRLLKPFEISWHNIRVVRKTNLFQSRITLVLVSSKRRILDSDYTVWCLEDRWSHNVQTTEQCDDTATGLLWNHQVSRRARKPSSQHDLWHWRHTRSRRCIAFASLTKNESVIKAV